MGSPEPLLAPAPLPGTGAVRRPLRSRWSFGHLVMVVSALLAALLNLVLLRAGDTTVQVAVAAVDLPAGVPVTADRLRFAAAGGDEGVVDALVRREDVAAVVGSVPRAEVPAGVPLRRSDLQPAAAPDGRRAMSIPVEPAHAAGGALTTGDRVDVITVAGGEARYVLTAAEVLAVASGGGGLSGLSGFSLTVAVDAEQALAVAEALQAGGIEVVRATGADTSGARG